MQYNEVKVGRKYYTDGAGWNSIISRTCVYYPGISGPVVKTFYQKFTNNECEWMGVLDALEHASKGDVIYTDSQLVVNQLKGEYRVKAQNLKPLFEKAKKLVTEKNISVLYIRREENLAGIHLDKTK